MTVPQTVFSPYVPPTLLVPTLPRTELSEGEQKSVQSLTQELQACLPRMMLRNAYYESEQRIADLGISIPPQLAGLHTVTGWPRIVVDPLDERLVVEGFRFPSSTDVDDDLTQVWQANDLDSEAPLAHLDALVYGRSFVIVGPGDDGAPLVTVESPTSMVAHWDPARRVLTEALQLYRVADGDRAALYLPDQTIHMARDGAGPWRVADRDVHNFGALPVVQMSNRQRTSDRGGRSEITREIMSITDSACRTLLGMEVAREFYSVPQRYILGASESDFQDSNGNPMAAWQAYLSKYLAFERDEDGNAPDVGQFAAYDPSVYTKIVDMFARNMAAITRYPPQMFGLFSDGNPASADAIRMAQDGLLRRAGRKQITFSGGWEDAMRLALRFTNGGRLPADAARLETEWAPVESISLAAVTDALTKQIDQGMIPATSDVTLKRAGWSAVDRQRLAQDRVVEQANQALDAVIGGLNANSNAAGSGSGVVPGGAVPAS